MKLGNKEQMKGLIEAVNGIERAIRDEKQEELTDTINDLMEELRRKHPD
jgi:pheromone shutdown protein TraB